MPVMPTLLAWTILIALYGVINCRENYHGTKADSFRGLL